MPKTKKLDVGTFLRIPLPDGSFAYGRAQSNPYIAFYNHRTSEPTSDLDEIASKPILFSQAVRNKGLESWTIIGQRPLQGKVSEPVVMFMQELADFRKCTIFDSAGMEREAQPEECIGIERAAVWEAHQIEERLLDTFMGRANEHEIRSRVRLE